MEGGGEWRCGIPLDIVSGVLGGIERKSIYMQDGMQSASVDGHPWRRPPVLGGRARVGCHTPSSRIASRLRNGLHHRLAVGRAAGLDRGKRALPVDCPVEARSLRLGNWPLLAAARCRHGRHVRSVRCRPVRCRHVLGEALALVPPVNPDGTLIARRAEHLGHGGHQDEGGPVELHGCERGGWQAGWLVLEMFSVAENKQQRW